jgi:Lon protease-like protein
MEHNGTGVWEEASELVEYPLLAVRDTVVFPHMMIPLFVGRDRSLRAVDEALDGDHCIVIVTQKEDDILDPTPEDLYDIGTVASIARMLRMPDGTTSVLVEGLQRARIVEYTQTQSFYRVKTSAIFEEVEEQPLTEALTRAALALFEKRLTSVWISGNGRRYWKRSIPSCVCRGLACCWPKSWTCWNSRIRYSHRFRRKLTRASGSSSCGSR